MNVKLVVVGGKTKPAEMGLKLPTTIGRGRDCTLTLPHPLVSRTHCELFEQDGRLMVRDLDSLNGTFVGNQRVNEAELPPDGLLTIGTVTFRAVYQGDVPGPGVPQLPPAIGDAETQSGEETAEGIEPASTVEGIEFAEVDDPALADTDTPASGPVVAPLSTDDQTTGLPPPAAPPGAPVDGSAQAEPSPHDTPRAPDDALHDFLKGLN